MIRAFASLCALLAAASCVSDLPETVEFVVAPVKRNVSSVEVRAAVERQLAITEVCIGTPDAYWRNSRTVEFGPVQWRGMPIASDVEARLDDFVKMGLWTKTAKPSEGSRVFEYIPTKRGQGAYRGRYNDAAFCLPAERKLVRVVSTRRDKSGTLHVSYIYTGDRPTWLPTDETAARYGAVLPPPGVPHEGTVSLQRVWRRAQHPVKGAPQSGALEPWCYDSVHNRPVYCAADFQWDRRAIPAS